MCEISESIDDELVIGAGCKFLFEKWANSGLRTLSGSELQKSHFRGEPFVSFPSEAETEIGVRRSVVPIIGHLALIDPGHELCGRDGILAFLSPEIRNFHEFLFERDVGVC